VVMMLLCSSPTFLAHANTAAKLSCLANDVTRGKSGPHVRASWHNDI